MIAILRYKSPLRNDRNVHQNTKVQIFPISSIKISLISQASLVPIKTFTKVAPYIRTRKPQVHKSVCVSIFSADV
jgi:hypothetical protein